MTKFAKLLTAFAVVLAQAHAGLILNFFPASDFNSNTAAMDATLGLTGFTEDGFETTSLIPGLTITLSGGVPTTTWTSLPNLFNENACPGLTTNAAWDGTDTVLNNPANIPTSCTSSSNLANTITFNYSPGAASFGIGMGNFQSLNAPLFPITNHELFVNGADIGTLETLAGSNWSPGLQRNAYLRIDATDGTSITSVAFENLTGADAMMLDHLAVEPSASGVPEPGTPGLAAIGTGLILAAKRRLRRHPQRTS